MLKAHQQFARILLATFLLTYCFVIAVFLALYHLGAPLWLTLTLASVPVGFGFAFAYFKIRTITDSIRSSVDKIVDFAEAMSLSNGAISPKIVIDAKDLPSMQRAHEAVNKLAAKPSQDLLEMRRLERVRSEFLGSVSHELRTPIFSIQGFLETLLDGALEDDAVRRNFVERAYSNTIRLNTLLTDLINISRIESGEMRLSFRYFPLVPLVEEIIANMGASTEHLHLTLRIDSRIHEDTEVFGDRDRLAQVLTNLVDNAMKYNVQNGSVTVLLEKIRDGKGAEEVRVSIQDTGIGIPAEHHGRIFERFYRVDKTRSRSVGGTGLGLAIVKHILEAHKSLILVQSMPTGGTTISFTLKQGE